MSEIPRLFGRSTDKLRSYLGRYDFEGSAFAGTGIAKALEEALSFIGLALYKLSMDCLCLMGTAKRTSSRFTFSRAVSLFVLVVLFGNISETFAHGGEDHGDQKVVAAAPNGMVTRSARVGDFEILLKHPSLAPDTATSARLFITQFATNEPGSPSDITAEIESVNGTVTKVPIERTDVAGGYKVEVPALAEGGYIFRATLNINGKTETATLSGITVGHQEPATIAGYSWSQTLLTALLFLIGAVLFTALIYLAIRTVRTRPMSEEAVAA